MTRIYSVDFREKVLETYRAGTPATEIAAVLHVAARSIYRWDAQEKATGSVAPRPKSGRPRAIGRDGEDALRLMVEAHPAATIDEYCQWWEERTGRRLGRGTMCDAINRLGLVRKKGVSSPVSSRMKSAPAGEKITPT